MPGIVPEGSQEHGGKILLSSLNEAQYYCKCPARGTRIMGAARGTVLYARGLMTEGESGDR